MLYITFLDIKRVFLQKSTWILIAVVLGVIAYSLFVIIGVNSPAAMYSTGGTSFLPTTSSARVNSYVSAFKHFGFDGLQPPEVPSTLHAPAPTWVVLRGQSNIGLISLMLPLVLGLLFGQYYREGYMMLRSVRGISDKKLVIASMLTIAGTSFIIITIGYVFLLLIALIVGGAQYNQLLIAYSADALVPLLPQLAFRVSLPLYFAFSFSVLWISAILMGTFSLLLARITRKPLLAASLPIGLLFTSGIIASIPIISSPFFSPLTSLDNLTILGSFQSLVSTAFGPVVISLIWIVILYSITLFWNELRSVIRKMYI